MSSYTQWIALDFACRLRCLQQGALNIGNTRQNVANLKTLALAQIATPSSPPWAKYSTAANMPKKILVFPSRVPGYVNPIGITGGTTFFLTDGTGAIKLTDTPGANRLTNK